MPTGIAPGFQYLAIDVTAMEWRDLCSKKLTITSISSMAQIVPSQTPPFQSG